MRGLDKLFVVATLISFVSLSSAAPAVSEELPSLIPRSDVCWNAPNTVAGSFLNRRTLFAKSPLPYRMPKEFMNPLLWCAPHCKTYIKITYINAIYTQSWQAVTNLLGGAEDEARQHLRANGDGVVSGGTFTFQLSGMELFIHDSNNHQVTWGVLDATLRALTEYFDELQLKDNAWPGSVTFVVHDGKNEVATGAIGTVQPDR